MDKVDNNHFNAEQFLETNYQKCKIHQKRLNVIRLRDDKDQYVLKCLKCLDKKQLSMCCIYLDELLDSEFETIFEGYPFFEDDEMQEKLRQITFKNQLINKTKERIEIFFKKLISNVIDMLQKKQDQIIRNLELKEQKENLINKYNEISQKEKLKDIIKNEYEDFEKQNSMLKEIIRNNIENQEQNNRILIDLINNFKEINLDIKAYDQIQEDILQNIESINWLPQKQDDQLLTSQPIYLRQQRIQSKDRFIHGSLLSNFRINQSQFSKLTEGEDLSEQINQKEFEVDFSFKHLDNSKVEERIEILRNKQDIKISRLNLENQNLSDDQILEISQILLRFNDMTSLNLNLRNNNLSNQKLKLISKTVSKIQSAHNIVLDLSENTLNDQLVETTTKIFKNQTITNLSLILNQCSLQDNYLKHFSILTFLQSNLERVQISLRKNSITNNGVSNIAKQLQGCQKTYLIILMNRQNKISMQALTNVLNCVRNCKNLSDLILHLNGISGDSENEIQENSLSDIYNIQSLELELSDSQINQEQICTILNGIKDTQVLSSLQLNLENLDIEALNLSDVLNKCHTMISLNLNLSHNNVQDDEFNYLSKALQQIENITNLDFRLSDNKISQEGIKLFAECLKVNINKLTLDFSLNKIGDEGIKIITDKLYNCIKIVNLNLYLNNSLISDEGISQISFALKKIKNIYELQLYLELNNITINGVNQLCSDLQECQKLVNLSLHLGSNEVQDEGAKSIAKYLENCQDLKKLELFFCNTKISNQGVQSIVDAIQKSENVNNLLLNFNAIAIQDQGAKYIGLGLEKCQNLTNLNLNLQQSYIQDQGAKYIGQGLEKCQNLTNLNLNLQFNIIEDQGAKYIGLSLEKCLNLTDLNLNLQYNNIQDQGAKCIGQSLEKSNQKDAYALSYVWPVYDNYAGDFYTKQYFPFFDKSNFALNYFSPIVSNDLCLHHSCKKSFSFNDTQISENDQIYLEQYFVRFGQNNYQTSSDLWKQYGSCYNHSQTVILTLCEEKIYEKSQVLDALSQVLKGIKHTLYCTQMLKDKKTGNYVKSLRHFEVFLGKDLNPTKSGVPAEAIRYASNYRVKTEAEYPYIGIQGACNITNSTTTKFKPVTFYYLSETSDDLRTALNHGPVSVALDPNNLRDYVSGVFNNCNATAIQINHAVLAVGYYKNGNWILKNSWANDWGQQGYFLLAPNNNRGVSQV
ncbi:hypothetical protein ABPG72_013426 [Tetrahymena utriculariae]